MPARDKLVDDIVEHLTVLRDVAAEQAEVIRNLWTGKDIRGSMNELLLVMNDARRGAFEEAIKVVRKEAGQ